jgi:hypothetical protein
MTCSSRFALQLSVVLSVIFVTLISGIGATRAEDGPQNTAAPKPAPVRWQDLNAQGVALSANGHPAEALAPLKQAFAACDAAGDQGTHCVALVNTNLCVALWKLNRTDDDAVSSCTLAVDAFKLDQAPDAQRQLFYADFNLADLLQKLHRGSAAEALFNEAFAIGEKPNSNVPGDDVASALFHLASIHRDQERFEEAVGELREVVARTQSSNVAWAIQALGSLQETLWRLLRDDEAEAAAQEALQLAQSKAAPGSSEMYFALNTVARQAIYMANMQEAEKMTRECVEHLVKYTAPENSNIVVQQQQLAQILEDYGQFGEALDITRQILAWHQRYQPKSRDVPILLTRISRLEHLAAEGRPAVTQAQLMEFFDAQRLRRDAMRKAAAGQWAEAEDLYRKSAEMADHAMPTESAPLGKFLYDIGVFFSDQERFHEAKPFLSRAVTIFKADQPDQRDMYSKALEGLAGVCEHLGEPALAETQWHDALAVIEAAQLERTNAGIVALHNYGAFLRNQSRFNEAEAIFSRTLAAREQTFGSDRPEAAVELNSLGLLYLQWGRYADAARALHRALAIEEKYGGPPTETKTFVLINLASLAQDEGRYAEAEEFHRRALDMREQLYGMNSSQFARTLRTIAEDELLKWHLPEAEALARQAIAIGEASGDSVRYQTSAAWQLLGRIEDLEQRPEDAVSSMGKAVALDMVLTNAERRGLLDSLFSQANALLSAGKYQDAINTADRALATAESTFAADSPGPLAAAYDKAADFRALAGYTTEASDLLERALAIRAQLFGSNSLGVAFNETRLVPYLLRQGRVLEADKLSKHASASAEDALGKDNPNLAPFLRNEASVAIALGQWQAAEILLRRALQLQEAALPADSVVIGPTLTALANDLAFQGRAQEAEPLASRALEIAETANGSAGPGLIAPLESLANVLAFAGKSRQALETSRRALQVSLSVFGPHHPTTAETMRIVGNGLARFDASRSDAESFLEGAIAIDKAAPAPVNFGLAADLNDLALVEEADGRSEQAREHLQQAIDMFHRAGFADSLSMAVALANLARVDITLGRKSEAASAADLSAAIFEKSGTDRVHRDKAL